MRSLALLLVLVLGGAAPVAFEGADRPPVDAGIPSSTAALPAGTDVSLGLSDLPEGFSADVGPSPGALPPVAAAALVYCLGLFDEDLRTVSESAFTRDDGLVSVYSLVASFYTTSAASGVGALLAPGSECLTSEFLPSLPQAFVGLDLSRVEVVTPPLPELPAGVSLRMLRLVVPLDSVPESPVFLDVAILSEGSSAAVYTSASGGAPLPLETTGVLLSALASRLPSSSPAL